ARAVAEDYDLPCGDAVVLAGGSNVLVHLRPTPAVARVMTATSVLHDDLQLWLTREVAVGEFLADRGLVVPPTRLMPPGPHQRDGLWLPVWDYVPHDREGTPPAAGELGDSPPTARCPGGVHGRAGAPLEHPRLARATHRRRGASGPP